MKSREEEMGGRFLMGREMGLDLRLSRGWFGEEGYMLLLRLCYLLSVELEYWGEECFALPSFLGKFGRVKGRR